MTNHRSLRVESPSSLAIIDELDLAGYHPFHAARADLLRREGRTAEAVEAYTRAIDLATDPAEQTYLRSQRHRVHP